MWRPLTLRGFEVPEDPLRYPQEPNGDGAPVGQATGLLHEDTGDPLQRLTLGPVTNHTSTLRGGADRCSP